ncbi:hypothetical protein OG605_39600 (plasmid) [Streptomyces xanthophaeus]|uniref:hypothetical protein n=1 Tax=Streptomyces xanthophaeus TaxID=67385 RepID=UPI002F90AE59|nr:hypothetical protein OG605_39600 [Streptomyces xanthophaeus]
MHATSFDQHVAEALALIAPARRPAPAFRPVRFAGAPPHGRRRLTLVRRTARHEGSEQ